MADRVKYFLLGLLFLVVAGVIAYDRWNTVPSRPPAREDMARIILSDPPVKPKPEVQVDPVPAPPVEPVPQPKTPETPKTNDGGAKPPAPKPPPNPNPVPGLRTDARMHTVAAGETLEDISVRYYGTRRGIATIVEANQISDPDHVKVGQKLKIPAPPESGRAPGGSAPVVKTPETKPGAPAPAKTKVPRLYTVRSGDGNLYEICRRFYGTRGEAARVSRIMDLNGLWSSDVKPGTVLRLPPE